MADEAEVEGVGSFSDEAYEAIEEMAADIVNDGNAEVEIIEDKLEDDGEAPHAVDESGKKYRIARVVIEMQEVAEATAKP